MGFSMTDFDRIQAQNPLQTGVVNLFQKASYNLPWHASPDFRKVWPNFKLSILGFFRPHDTRCIRCVGFNLHGFVFQGTESIFRLCTCVCVHVCPCPFGSVCVCVC
eukprot:scpid105762/ scgid10804/ 